jgi:hypothetical protein
MPIRGKGKSRGGNAKTRLLGTKPCPPTGVSAVDVGTDRPYDNGAVTVTFTPDSSCAPATSYTATASSGHSASGSSSPLTIVGIPTGSSVTVTVKATNQYGDSASSSASSPVTVTTVPSTPSAPSASSANPQGNPGVNQAGTTTDTVSWSAPANNGGKAITNYQWASSDGKGNTTTGTSVTVNQEGNTQQTYQVRAYNANGWSQYSANSSNVTTFSFTPFSVFGFSPFNVFGFSPTPPFSVFGFSPFNVFGFSPTPPFSVFGFSPSPPFGVFGFSPTFGVFGFSPTFGVFGFSPTFSVFGFSPTQKAVSVFGETKLRTPNGLVLASALQVGDQLTSVILPGLPEEGWTVQDVIDWNLENPTFDFANNLVTTTVTEIVTNITNKIVFINGDAFSGQHAILVKRDNIAKMIMSDDVLLTDEIWSLQHNSWVPITALDKYEAENVVYSINTEPYDIFFTESMLVHDTRPDM